MLLERKKFETRVSQIIHIAIKLQVIVQETRLFQRLARILMASL